MVEVNLKRVDLIKVANKNFVINLQRFDKDSCLKYLNDYGLISQGSQYIFRFNSEVIAFYKVMKISNSKQLKHKLVVGSSRLEDAFHEQPSEIKLELYNECYTKKSKLASHLVFLIDNDTVAKQELLELCRVHFSRGLVYQPI